MRDTLLISRSDSGVPYTNDVEDKKLKSTTRDELSVHGDKPSYFTLDTQLRNTVFPKATLTVYVDLLNAVTEGNRP